MFYQSTLAATDNLLDLSKCVLPLNTVNARTMVCVLSNG